MPPLRYRGSVVRAVLLDLDGTLYCQRRLRLRMAGELAGLPVALRSGRQAWRVWHALRLFRRVREELRTLGEAAASLERLQYTAAARRAGVSEAEMEALVAEWMHRRPLRHLHACRRPGVEDLLRMIAGRGLPAGVFSDYPAAAKLESLRLVPFVSLEICATDPAVNAFKPHARGFLAACERWSLSPGEVLYVGDRPEVDAAGALAAGMPCAIVGRRPENRRPYSVFRGFRELMHALHSH